MVGALGVLHRTSMRAFSSIYAKYRSCSEDEWERWKRDEIAAENLFTYNPTIKVIGCWDTVGALGIPEYSWVKALGWNNAYKFHRAELGSSELAGGLRQCRVADRTNADVENAFQALALEEHRGTHAPTLWHLPPGSKARTSLSVDVGGLTQACCRQTSCSAGSRAIT